MYAARLWSVRNSRWLERLYDLFALAMLLAHPLLARIGYARLESPVAAIERRVKGLLFDCRMCGMCILGATGMSCPMNCPKSLRNGPCGGVRPNGNCEVEPEMRCVWVEAWEGAQRMRGSPDLADIQMPVDNSLAGTSAWLRDTRQAAARRQGAGAE